jgi:phage minor structural protein
MFAGYVDNQLMFATSQPSGKEIISGTLTDEVNAVSSLEFTIPLSNDTVSSVKPHTSVIKLESDGREIFRGTVNSVSKNFRGDTVVSCDGMIALMADVIKEPFTVTSRGIESYVTSIVKNYNDGVTADKEIKVGAVVGFENQTFSVSHSQECKNIFELLKELRSEKGGYIWSSYIGGDVYINYTKTIGKKSDQQIAFGSNLVSIEDQLEVGTLVTRVWPLGNEGLTIASVNDGKAYLQNEAVELRYGRVDKTVQVDSNDPYVVKSYGQAYLTRYAAMRNTITLTAIDLHNLDKSISSFEVGDSVRVLSPPHGIDAEMVVNTISTDLVQISNSRITLGAKKGSITSIISSGGGASGSFGGDSGGVGVDYVIDQGTTGKWVWRKWASGIAEMWAAFDTDKLVMTEQTWGSLYTASWMGLASNKEARAYPFAFIESPIVSATPTVGSGNIWLATNTENDIGTRLTHAPAYQCVRASDATVNNPQISYYVMGKYK